MYQAFYMHSFLIYIYPFESRHHHAFSEDEETGGLFVQSQTENKQVENRTQVYGYQPCVLFTPLCCLAGQM